MTKTTDEMRGRKGGFSNTTAGAMGAVVGGMVGAAAGIALSDKERRKIIMKKMEDLKRYVSGAVQEIQEMTKDSTDMIAEKAMPNRKAKMTRAKKRVN